MNPLALLLRLAIDLMSAIFAGIFGAFGLGANRAVRALRIRPAMPEEVLGVRHEVLRAGRPPEDAVFEGDHDRTTRHWVVQQHDRIVGVASVMTAPRPDLPGAPTRQLRGMAVVDALSGSGLGSALLRELELDEGQALWCNARVTAAGFYLRNGWQPTGEPFDIEGIGPHQVLVKQTT